jgi:hypothetical protein
MNTAASILYPHQPQLVKDEEMKDEEENEEKRSEEPGEDEGNEDDDEDDEDEDEEDDVDTFLVDQRFSGDIKAQRQLARSLLQSYAAEPLDDAPLVVSSTAINRKRIMEAWNV